MSSLLKQGSGAIIDLALPPTHIVPPSVSECVDPTTPLRQEIDALRHALQKQEEKHAKALATVREEGRTEGKAAVIRDEAKALAALEAGIQTAAQIAQAKFKTLDQLALLLCQTALENVFDESADMTDLTRRAIRRQMMGLRRHTILRVCISPTDFADQASMSALAQALGANFEIAQDGQLTSGCCRMELKLGAIEVSLPEHWQALQARLRSLATGTTP